MSFYLQKIQLINFRCYQNRVFSFSPHCNIIVGLNASGKTSLVEGIYCLSFAKTFRDAKEQELIKKGKTYYNLKGDFYNGDKIDKIILSYDSKEKRIIKNHCIYKSISQYLGYFNIVVFAPDDLEIIKGGPNNRRRLLDIYLGQTNFHYLQALIKYKKILKERNEYLKTINSEQYDKVLLDAITTSLINEASIIIKERKGFVKELNKHLNPVMMRLSKGRERTDLVYKPNCVVDELWKTYQERKKIDLIMKTTTWGPSRDDVLILVNDEKAVNFCSQGQIRSVCLAIKLGLVQMIKQVNERIIIILDDVFSELDCHRQNEILKLLDNNKQTFITTTMIENLSRDILNNSSVIKIERGNDDD